MMNYFQQLQIYFDNATESLVLVPIFVSPFNVVVPPTLNVCVKANVVPLVALGTFDNPLASPVITPPTLNVCAILVAPPTLNV